MKKNLFFGLFATMVLLLTTACQKENDLLGNGEATISFEISTPQMATRAFSDGTTATQLQYAVYHKVGENFVLLRGENKAQLNGKKAHVDVQLATGKTYYVFFWAQHPDAPFEPDYDALTMKVNYGNCNDENYDAFYWFDDVTVEGAATVDVTLKRPFAQLNIGTNDLAKIDDVSVATTAVTVKNVYNTFNFASGNVVGDAAEVTFAVNARPASEAFPVTGYEYLAMNYMFVQQEGDVLNEVIFTYDNGNGNKSRTFTNIPVKPNHRTNIYGALLTNNIGFDVEIEEDFTEDNKYGVIDGKTFVKVSGSDEFKEAFAAEDVDMIILSEDITIDESITRATNDATLAIGKGKELIIDLGGYKMSATSTQTGKNYDMFDVRGTLTVKNGTIEYKHIGENMGWSNSTCIFNITAGGVLNLENVEAYNLGGSDMAFVAHLNNWGECTLNVEKSFLKSTYIPVRVFNSGYDMNNVTIKNTTLNGKYCFWVHNYKAAGDNVGTDETLNFDIFNGTNTFEYTSKAPVLYGFANPIYYDADGNLIKSLEDLITEVTYNTGTITISSARDLMMLEELDAKWVEMFSDGNGKDYTNYANGKGAGYYYDWTWTIKLDADIDFKRKTLNKPINIGRWGLLDGNGHTIKNVNIVTADNVETQAALFVCGRYNEIKNLNIDNVVVEGSFVGNSTAAILASDCHQLVERVTITNSSVVGGKYTGAVVGYGYCKVNNCVVENCTVKGGYKLGGIIGYVCSSSNNASVDNNTLTKCTVNGADGQYAGGKSEYIIGKVVGNYNANGTCKGNTVSNMTTAAIANIGKIEADMTVEE